MATSIDYIEFVCDQIAGSGAIRYKKMFGEYMVYINDKPILLVCDNTVFVKNLGEIAELTKNSDCGIPYNGAKEHYILDIENSELSKQVISLLESITPLPKPKNKK